MNVSADRAREAWKGAQTVFATWRAGAAAPAGPQPLQEAWGAVASVLQALAPDVAAGDAKALVGALRHEGLCTLDEAHSLIDLHAAAMRETEGQHAVSDMHRQMVIRASHILERVLTQVDGSVSSASLQEEYSRASARVPAADIPVDRTAHAASDTESARRTSSGTPMDAPRMPSPTPPSSRTARGTGALKSSRFVVGLVVACLVCAGLAALLFARAMSGDPMQEGIEAYQAGQRVVARLAFERALSDDPSDARPLIYLGRLSREEGDLATARRLLEQAVQRAPDNALTHRELGSALLADGQPELARRFYVRALSINPNDRLAQGYLGCSLARLGRVDEARRWLDRAGPGDWMACAAQAYPVP